MRQRVDENPKNFHKRLPLIPVIYDIIMILYCKRGGIMPAATAKYILHIAGVSPSNFEVIDFSGIDAIGTPYSFDINFRMSRAAKASKAAPPDKNALGKPCRLEIIRNGETISYCGIAARLRASDSEEPRYAIRLVPNMHRLTLNKAYSIFQKRTVLGIIKSVIADAGLTEYFRFEVEPDDVKYPALNHCVQHRETDFAFISRLMEESGIWYYFELVKEPGGTLKERAVVTDDFSLFPSLGRPIPFMKGKGLAEITETGNAVESINRILSFAKLMPKDVRIRAYNYRTPESAPDGISGVTGGHEGRIYEHGGKARNSSEAGRRATLYARRLWVDSLTGDGAGNCASLRAGTRVNVKHDGNKSLDGVYLLLSVKHTGGWDVGAYTYRNEFSYVRAEPGIYAPPLRTPVPQVDGVVTAFVGATGDSMPTLSEDGGYNVNMPELPEGGRGGDGQRIGDHGGSKDIRVAQPSGGMSDKGPYGIHFPSKRGAEMVVTHIDGDPDRPVGLGFVPNAAAPSVVTNMNCTENVLRSWGGSELVMDDAAGNESSRLSTPGGRGLELDDGDGLARLRSEQCEVLFDDDGKKGVMRAGEGYGLSASFEGGDGAGKITVATGNGNLFEMDDEGDTITLQNAGGGDGDEDKRNAMVLDGGEKAITLGSVDSSLVVSGRDERVTMESVGSKIAVDGGGEKVFMGDRDSSLTVDGGDGSVSFVARGDIILRAGGRIIIDAKGGIVNKSGIVDFDAGGGGAAGGGASSGAGSSADSQAKAEETQEAENSDSNDASENAATGTEETTDEPVFSGLKWIKDGGEVDEALVHDNVYMCCEVKNIGDGVAVNVIIYEHDDDGEHDYIDTLTGQVKDGKVEVPWEVEYHEDDDDIDSAEEMERLGYTLPEYFFVVEYGGAKSVASGVLEVGEFVDGYLYDEDTGEILTNTNCILHLPDGSTISSMSDEQGFVRVENLPHVDIIISRNIERG
jgi:type VI secretion system secreted protein VgrG